MRKYIIDFEFNEKTGESNIIIDLVDESMSALEMNEAIASGELTDELAEQTGRLFGAEIAQGVRAGRIKPICLDHHPELRKQAPGIAIPVAESPQKKDIKQ